jgi:hypothetical protein
MDNGPQIGALTVQGLFGPLVFGNIDEGDEMAIIEACGPDEHDAFCPVLAGNPKFTGNLPKILFRRMFGRSLPLLFHLVPILWVGIGR